MSGKRIQVFLESEPKDQKYSAKNVQSMIRDLNKELANPPKSSKGQCSYTTRYAYEQIKEELDNLQEKGFNFRYDQNKRPFFQNQTNSHVYEIKRVLKLRFKCKNNRCPEFIRQEAQRKWTTYYGLVEFSFFFEVSKHKRSTPTLRINMKIYGQKCLKCQQWGSGSIMQSNMEALCKIYGLILEIILRESKDLRRSLELHTYEKYGQHPEKKKGMKQDFHYERGVISHQQKLCQACYKGKCIYFYNPKKLQSEK